MPQDPKDKGLKDLFVNRKKAALPVPAQEDYKVTASPETSPHFDWMALPESKPQAGAPVGSDAVMSKRRAISDFAREVLGQGPADVDKELHPQSNEKLRQIIENPENASRLLSDEQLWGSPFYGDTEHGSVRGGTGGIKTIEKDFLSGEREGRVFTPEMKSVSGRRKKLEDMVLALQQAMAEDKGVTPQVGAKTASDISMKEKEISDLMTGKLKAEVQPTGGPKGEEEKTKVVSGYDASIEAMKKGLNQPSKPSVVPQAPEQNATPTDPSGAAGVTDTQERPRSSSPMLSEINNMFPALKAKEPGVLEGIVALLGGFLSGKPQPEMIDRLLGKPEVAAREGQRSGLLKSMMQQRWRAENQGKSERDRAMRIAIAQYGVEAKPALTKLFSVNDEMEGLESSLMPPDKKTARRTVLEAQEAAIYKALADMQGKYGVTK